MYVMVDGEVMVTQVGQPLDVIGRGGTFGVRAALGFALGPKGHHLDQTVTGVCAHACARNG